MSDVVRLALALLVAAGVTTVMTPIAIAIARRTSFYDRPVGYKGHSGLTPYLGGCAVVTGTIAGGLFGWGSDSLVVVFAGALALLLLGTIDDRRNLGPLLRLAAELAVAAGLYAGGVSWSIFSSDLLNLVFTIVFVAGVVNAYNLMDNMDGATSSVAAASGLALGAWAAIDGDPALGAVAFALSGACLAFLRFNLARPSQIFLGDGGSMPVGLVVAAVIMSLPATGGSSWALLPAAVVLVGLPALDTTLVVISRIRRTVHVFTGGRDHLTHRLRPKLGSSARRVAALLATAQAAVCVLGACLLGSGEETVAGAGSIVLILIGLGVITLLESPGWAPATSELSASGSEVSA
jgi:UDP-GlcNAc:undecaprenyl-phosphate GlcNAc-1-phosphate transferase